MSRLCVLTIVTLASLWLCPSSAFTAEPHHGPLLRRVGCSRYDTSVAIFDKVGAFFEELDAFVDDATARRLGNGAAFYGKRKSSFYGEEDKGRKRDKSIPDPTEDYQGPTSSGFFKWMPDENGQMRPVTRMKEKNLERNPSFWDKVYDKKEE